MRWAVLLLLGAGQDLAKKKKKTRNVAKTPGARDDGWGDAKKDLPVAPGPVRPMEEIGHLGRNDGKRVPMGMHMETAKRGSTAEEVLARVDAAKELKGAKVDKKDRLRAADKHTLDFGSRCLPPTKQNVSFADTLTDIEHPMDAGSCVYVGKSDQGIWCLPSTLIIGDRLAGSDVLGDWLSGHPHLDVAEAVEFLTGPRFHPMGEYEQIIRYYPLQVPSFERTKEELKAGIRNVERGAAYTHQRAAPKLFKGYLSSLRVVLVVRHPIEQLFASFLQDCQDERLGAFRYDADEKLRHHVRDREAADWVKQHPLLAGRKPSCDADGFHAFAESLAARRAEAQDWREAFLTNHLVLRAMADKVLELWGRLFQCNLYVLDYADLAADPAKAARDVLHWLNVPPTELPRPDSALAALPPMRVETKELLGSFFAQSLERSAALFPPLEKWRA